MAGTANMKPLTSYDKPTPAQMKYASAIATKLGISISSKPGEPTRKVVAKFIKSNVPAYKLSMRPTEPGEGTYADFQNQAFREGW